MNDIPTIFGSMVFNDNVMKERLPIKTYNEFKKNIASGQNLNIDIANEIADAMKEWAIEKGATHYTHWFQPMTGITAEKHNSFIEPDNNHIIMKFRGKELISGESDASSFPSGGLRAIFEARGYTAWDPTSYAFIKNNTLCIPTVFCSYSGEVLDKKTPLLRSMEAINKESLRILKLFKNNSKQVIPTVGPEQEYFLIDKEMYLKRPDLINCGRTLIGAKPPRGQELEDHYYGIINSRVTSFMKELDEELWKLGIYAKTKHNEAAPAQHEFAPIFTIANLASDHNQLTMELMRSIADKHHLVCLLHEKPFAGINGSGKHNNWSLSTDDGKNLLEPGDNPATNTQFLLILCAIIKAVCEYQDLLRISVSTAGNDHRLGGNEAPPAIISIFLGDELLNILESIENEITYNNKDKSNMEIGVKILPLFLKDNADRNRTSPFAFTSNKFEFRMLGSPISISCPTFILNTIVADSLSYFADILEPSKNLDKDIKNLMKDTIKKYKKIIFNGNNYSKEWIKEAEKRGLLNLESTVDALQHFTTSKNINLFKRHNVLSEKEIHSRCEILIENYIKTLHIEALTLINMIKQDIIPSTLQYIKNISDTANAKKNFNSKLNCTLEKNLITNITNKLNNINQKTEDLTRIITILEKDNYSLDIAKKYRELVYNNIETIRKTIDDLELIVDRKYWPYPSYSDILNSTN